MEPVSSFLECKLCIVISIQTGLCEEWGRQGVIFKGEKPDKWYFIQVIKVDSNSDKSL